MRKIIILQSFLILAGAYYIYTLQQSASPASDAVNTSTQDNTTDQITTESSSATSTAEAQPAATSSVEVESSSEISGASDVGMEFPIPDDEADLQVR